MANKKNTILTGVILAVCIGGLFMLFLSSSVSIFSVKELMDTPNAESYIDRRIQLVGNVTEINSTHFTIIDPEVSDNDTLKITVLAVNVERPTGFELDRTVVVEGKLLSISNIWTFHASMISTKCPSKYS
jgi:cytochrome c-type biogenesis protein CcmE